MASAMIKCSFRSALRGGASHGTPAFKRTYASSAHHDEAREAAKWEKITYVGIITCTILAIVNLSKGHPHHEEPPVSFIYAFLVPPYMSTFSVFFNNMLLSVFPIRMQDLIKMKSEIHIDIMLLNDFTSRLRI
uniref:Cytochrome c oxidase subunit 6a, mitochondrial-like n=1 Tax=Nicotiana sylvestris TaxID=4096 RepID=A0A1U7VV99_NICSY|nr:PREDICTED: cytochrome c oxidase subunit 6a, mitochondrial-like [Nicotiana sylvestris]